MRAIQVLSALAAALCLAGCAGVKVMKVQVAPGDKEPEGIPFYLPRAYVQVYEPFVIGSKAYLATGQVTPDGQFLLLDNLTGELAQLLGTQASQGSGSATFPLANVRLTTPGNLAGGTIQSDTPAGSSDADKKDDSAKKDDGAKKEDGKTDGAGQGSGTAAVGQFNTSVTQSQVPFPSTLGRRFFDVVWLPNYEEKYVVQTTPGLGNANINVTMVQGWGLAGLDAKIDNSAVVKPLLDFYSGVAGALLKAAQAKIVPAAAIAGAIQSDDPNAKPRTPSLTPGTRVSAKVTKVIVAAPGLYPVIHPTEMKKNPAARAGILAPQFPFTDVAFNTYEVLVVEAAKPSGDTPMNLQRYFDTDAQGNRVPTPASQQPGSPPALNADEFTRKVNDILKDRKSADNAIWVISQVKVEGGKLKATATLTGGKQKPAGLATSDALKNFLSVQSNFNVGDIELTEK
jgi:hypothetical protein